jgi:PAS domain S-box-containing protein
MIAKNRQLRTVIGWTAITALSVTAGLLGGWHAHNKLLLDHLTAAQHYASAFLPEEMPGGGTGDLAAKSPLYLELKHRLERLRQGDPQVRLLYLLHHDNATGRTTFIADSQPENNASLLHPGDEFLVNGNEALVQTLRLGQSVARPPIAKDDAYVMTGYAPLVGPDGATTEFILGVEAAPGEWRLVYWREAIPPLLYVWFLLGLPFAVYRNQLRHRQQREALRNLSEAMEQSRSAVMILSVENRIEYVNAGLCQQVGYSRRELIGKPWRDFQQAETTPEVLAEMAATVHAGRSWHGEWYLRRKSGELYVVRGDISPVKNREGRIISFVAVFEDMTDSKRTEALLRAALDRAEAGDRAKSQFLATMSHEVRTPLNGIVGFTSLLAEMPLAPEAREYVQTIQTSGEALIQLTGDILDFARIESGSLKLEAQPASPRAVVEDALDLFAVQAAERGIYLLHWVEEDVPAAILIDDARLRQVLANLVGNAVKFTEAGSVSVTLQLIPGTPAWLRFAVKDTGIGIAAEHQGALFKPFRQVDESTTRRYGGTGLGLAISRNLVEMMDGEIEMHSVLGEGSTFSFRIPSNPAAGLPRTPPRLDDLKLAVVAAPGACRDQFEALARRWGAIPVSADDWTQLAGLEADVACIDLSKADVAMLAEAPAGSIPWPAARAFGFVPIGLDGEVRKKLLVHMGHLINKPPHHDAVAGIIAGVASESVPEKPPQRNFGLNALVVEDNVVNQRLVQRLLTNLGCTSTVAGNGLIGLETLQAMPMPFDLVLMDLHMPELDGLGAIAKIRGGEAGDAAKNIWITVLTADARSEQKDKVFETGANDYLVKPVGLSDLGKSLQRFAERAV